MKSYAWFFLALYGLGLGLVSLCYSVYAFTMLREPLQGLVGILLAAIGVTLFFFCLDEADKVR